MALQLSNSIISANPDLAGAFGVYAYNGPAWATAIKEAGPSAGSRSSASTPPPTPSTASKKGSSTPRWPSASTTWATSRCSSSS